MKKLNKLLAVVLGGMMGLMLLTGCMNRGSGSVVPVVEPDFSLENKLTISWLIPSQQSIKLKDIPLIKNVEEKFNVNLEIEELSVSLHNEQVDLRLGAKNQSDITSWVTMAHCNENGSIGAYINFAPYLDDMPNFKALVDDAIAENPYNENVLYNTEGNLFGLPHYMTDPINLFDFSYNKEAFAEVGYDNPTTWSEVKAALLALKEKYSTPEREIYPLSFRNHGTVTIPLQLFVESFTEAQASTLDFIGFDIESDQFKFALEVPGYKEGVLFFADLYTSGLIDPEYITNDEDVLKNRVRNERVFMIADYIGGWSGSTTISDYIGYKLYPMAIPKAEGKKQVVGRRLTNFDSTVATALKGELANDPTRLGRCLMILDYIYSEEFFEMQWYNEDVADKNEDGTYTYKDNVYDTEGDYQTLRDTYFPWNINACFQDTQDERPDPDTLQPYINYRDNILRGEGSEDRYGVYPIVNFTPTEQRRINQLVAAINDQYRLSIADFAEGKKGEEEWDDFVNTLIDYGADDLIKIYNDAYVRYKAKQ